MSPRFNWSLWFRPSPMAACICRPTSCCKSTDLRKGDPSCSLRHSIRNGDLPDPLPYGAHRVISTMTSAQMRKMMEGVVLYRHRPKCAQLNGYTAGGKTGTAQKIDVLTHRYSKTKYIASFVGIAPVNNPAISVAIVMDSPEAESSSVHRPRSCISRIGAADSRISRRPARSGAETSAALSLANAATRQKKKRGRPRVTEDLNSLFAEVNDLPADDPLRAPQQTPGQAAPVAKNAASGAGCLMQIHRRPRM